LQSEIGCERITIATPFQLSADDQDLVAHFKAAYDQTGGTMKAVRSYYIGALADPPSPPGPVAQDPYRLTAYDVANNFQVEAELLRRVEVKVLYGDENDPIQQLVNAIGRAIDKLWFGIDPQFTVVIQFEDGSRVKIEIKQEGQFLPSKLVEAADPNGLAVLRLGAGNAAGYQGEHAFNSMRDAQNWLNNARMNGVTITNGGGDLPQVTCEWDGESKLTCYIN